jgi:hypothetical protein
MLCDETVSCLIFVKREDLHRPFDSLGYEGEVRVLEGIGEH